MMRSKTPLPAVGVFACLVLAACATPQEQCQKSLDTEMTAVTRLIAVTEANLERGYAFEQGNSSSGFGVTFCTGDGPFRFCYGNSEFNPTREPVAIDPEVEQRKLQTLQARRSELLATQCRGDGVRLSGLAR